MANEERKITQPEGARFRVALEGQEPDDQGCLHPIVHHGVLAHEGGAAERPLRHVLRMDQDVPCELGHSGEMRHTGDPERPVPLDMRHSSPEPVVLDLKVNQARHALAVDTSLTEPMHHALQLKTPLQVRFVNPWEAKSDYAMTVELAGRPLLSFKLQGTTTLRPEAAPPDPCLESGGGQDGPGGLRVRTMTDVIGQKSSGS
jgi:hypothetical protein